jgi:hypothetical protein
MAESFPNIDISILFIQANRGSLEVVTRFGTARDNRYNDLCPKLICGALEVVICLLQCNSWNAAEQGPAQRVFFREKHASHSL